MIDWGEDGGVLPAHLMIFVDLRNLTEEEQELSGYPAAIYAVIESAKPNKKQEEQRMSELFVPYIKELGNGHNAEGEPKRKYYLVDCDSIVAPTVMIPDVGNTNNAAYLRLTPQHEWAKGFERWLDKPHSRRFADDD